LYIFFHSNDGVVLANGFKPFLAGKNLFDIQDSDGKYLIKDMIAMPPGTRQWYSYKWPNTVTKAIDLKTSYVIRTKDYHLGVGVHVNQNQHANSD
jgi:signal transduction histidine kinase